jgi:hypothetical protein
MCKAPASADNSYSSNLRLAQVSSIRRLVVVNGGPSFKKATLFVPSLSLSCLNGHGTTDTRHSLPVLSPSQLPRRGRAWPR